MDPVMDFLPVQERIMDLSVCIPLALKVSTLQAVGFVPLVLTTKQSLNPPVWSFIENIVRPIKLLWVIVD
jgi:hypothetical protein